MSNFPGTISLTYQATGLDTLQRQYESFLAFVASHQPNVNFGGGSGGGGGGALTFAGGSGGGSGGGGGPSYGGTGTYSNILNATQNINSSVSNQVRNLMTSINNSVQSALTQQFSSYQSSVDNSVTNVIRGGGRSSGGGGLGLGGGLSRILGPYMALHAIGELNQHLSASTEAEFQSTLARSPVESLRAQMRETESWRTGFFGGISDFAQDKVPGYFSGGVGPVTAVQQRRELDIRGYQDASAHASLAGASSREASLRTAYGTGGYAGEQAMEVAKIHAEASRQQDSLEVEYGNIAKQRSARYTKYGGSYSAIEQQAEDQDVSRQNDLRNRQQAIGDTAKFMEKLHNDNEQTRQTRESIYSQGSATASRFEAARNPLAALGASLEAEARAKSFNASPQAQKDAWDLAFAKSEVGFSQYSFRANSSITANKGDARVNELYTGGQPFYAQYQTIQNQRNAERNSVLEGPLAQQERDAIDTRYNSAWDRYRYDWKNDSMSGLASLGIHNAALTALAQGNDPLRDLKAQSITTSGNALVKAFEASIGGHPEFTKGILQSGILGLQAERRDYLDRFRAEEADPSRIATGPDAGEDMSGFLKSIDERIAALEDATSGGSRAVVKAIEDLGKTK